MSNTKEKMRRIETALKRPFSENEIEWRVQQSGESNASPWALVLAYVQSRAIMDRLDQVMTPFGWQNEFIEFSGGAVNCRIGIRIDGDKWIWKGDGAGETQVEATKGSFSDAMKRAGYQWGIGRYLYNLDTNFANFVKKGSHRYRSKINGTYYYWNPPKLPDWALPKQKLGRSPINQ